MNIFLAFLLLLMPSLSFGMKDSVAIRNPVGAPVIRNTATAGTPVTVAYSTLVAATTYACSAVLVFNTSDVSIYLSQGAAAAEVDKFILPPASFGSIIPIEIPKGVRVAVKGTGTSTTGFFSYTCFQ